MDLLTVERQENKAAVVLIWNNANWHISKRIKQWIRDYNQLAGAGLPESVIWIKHLDLQILFARS